jgi:hypothetical protein
VAIDRRHGELIVIRWDLNINEDENQRILYIQNCMPFASKMFPSISITASST